MAHPETICQAEDRNEDIFLWMDRNTRNTIRACKKNVAKFIVQSTKIAT